MTVCARPDCEQSVPARRQVFCSAECYRAGKSEKYRITDDLPVTRIQRGTIGELRVAIELIEDGFDVFRAVNSDASCDLVAIRGDEVLRIEVRTARRKANGDWTCDRNGQYDVLALVGGNEIQYEDAN